MFKMWARIGSCFVIRGRRSSILGSRSSPYPLQKLTGKGPISLSKAWLHFGWLWICYNTKSGSEIGHFGVWAAPGAPETLPEGGGRSPPPFGRAAQAPKTTDFRPLKHLKSPPKVQPRKPPFNKNLCPEALRIWQSTCSMEHRRSWGSRPGLWDHGFQTKKLWPDAQAL